MKTIKLYLRPFLITGISFGTLMALWDYFEKEKIDFKKLIFLSIFFGAMMSWSTVRTQKRREKKMSANPDE